MASTVYLTEPPTKGKVLLRTSVGDVDIELWSREAPYACRSFLQLALDGGYDGLPFHRVIRGLLVQTGDTSLAGGSGEAAGGGWLPDEFHSRLKFLRRGIVAAASRGEPNSAGSQFFITLDKAPWLERKHTIFGKVAGDTIFNVLRLGETETDADDAPLEAPRVLGVDILDNPFPGMARSAAASAAAATTTRSTPPPGSGASTTLA